MHDITQFFVIEFVPSAVLSLTDYLKQKNILHKPRCCILTFCNQAVPDQLQIRLWHVQNVLLERPTTSVFKLRTTLNAVSAFGSQNVDYCTSA